MLMLAANTVLLLLIYFYLPSLIKFSYLPTIYLFLGGALGLYYVIYNRGFSGKNVTPDMLPDTMTLEEKQQFIEDCKQRLQKSKWVLTILIPIVLVSATSGGIRSSNSDFASRP